MSRYTADEHVKAAYLRLRSGDTADPDNVVATRRARSDLIARTWKSDREMTRDERRLFDRYSRRLAEHDDEVTAKYLP